jgi:WD40 repeat protein
MEARQRNSQEFFVTF